MDTSPGYIEMCAKAKEIQDLHNAAEDGNFICENYSDDFSNGTIYVEGEFFRSPRSVWLPRQDQLQQLANASQTYMGLVNYMEDYIEQLNEEIDIDDSPEIMWLQAVMFLEYGKKWKGGSWVKSLNRNEL